MWSSSMSLLPLALLMAISEATSQTNHVVTVGKGSQLKFDPEILKAGVGDTITYQFFAKVSGRGGCKRDSSNIFLEPRCFSVQL